MNYLSAIDRRFISWSNCHLTSIRSGLAEAVVAELAESSGDDCRWLGGGTVGYDVTSVEDGRTVRRDAKSVRLEASNGVTYVVLARRNAQPFDPAKVDRIVLVLLAEATSGFNIDLDTGVASVEGHAAIDRVWDLSVADLNELMPVHDPAVDGVWRNVELPVEDLDPFIVWSRDQEHSQVSSR